MAIAFLIANTGQKPAIADANFDLASDLTCQSDGWIIILHALVEALQVNRNLRAGTGNL
jgi:hypothetical protein